MAANSRDLLERVATRDRDEHVDPARARRLRKALELEQVERLLDEPRDLDHLLEPGALGGVEVEHHPVGTLGAIDPRRPRVQVDAAHVRHPQERELVVHDRVVDDAPLAVRVEAGNGARSIQSGMCDGAFFWKKLLPCQPSG